MPACTFDQPFKGSAEELVANAKKGILANGGTFNGDATHGSFSVKGVVGTYTVHGQTAHFVITSKPFLVSCSFIQSTLNRLVNPTSAGVTAEVPVETPKKKPRPSTKATKRTKTTKSTKKTKKARPAARARTSRPVRRAKRGSKKR